MKTIDQTTAARIAEAAKQCACGAHGAIMLHKLSTHEFTPRRDLKLPACGPCAVVLMEQGWTPERNPRGWACVCGASCCDLCNPTTEREGN